MKTVKFVNNSGITNRRVGKGILHMIDTLAHAKQRYLAHFGLYECYKLIG